MGTFLRRTFTYGHAALSDGPRMWKLYRRVFSAHCVVAIAYPFYKGAKGEYFGETMDIRPEVVTVPSILVLTGLVWPAAWLGLGGAALYRTWQHFTEPSPRKWYEDSSYGE